jgi:hypothetical protein
VAAPKAATKVQQAAAALEEAELALLAVAGLLPLLAASPVVVVFAGT